MRDAKWFDATKENDEAWIITSSDQILKVKILQYWHHAHYSKLGIVSPYARTKIEGSDSRAFEVTVQEATSGMAFRVGANQLWRSDFELRLRVRAADPVMAATIQLAKVNLERVIK